MHFRYNFNHNLDEVSQNELKIAVPSGMTWLWLMISICYWAGLQLFDRVSCTYTYLLADKVSKEAILIDPVVELVDRDLQLIKEIGLKVNQLIAISINRVINVVQLRYVANTHVHADHITGSGLIKTRLNTNSSTPTVKSIISGVSGAEADIKVAENDVITCGDAVKLKVLSTPGALHCPLRRSIN